MVGVPLLLKTKQSKIVLAAWAETSREVHPLQRQAEGGARLG
jgi:hypothetical protein